jgi:hypothetical protein
LPTGIIDLGMPTSRKSPPPWRRRGRSSWCGELAAGLVDALAEGVVLGLEQVSQQTVVMAGTKEASAVEIGQDRDFRRYPCGLFGPEALSL